MVKVKLFGPLRLDTGLKELDADVDSLQELYPILLAQAKAAKPDAAVTAKDIDGCIAVVNDKPAKKSAKLRDGDVVMLMSPVCGG